MSEFTPEKICLKCMRELSAPGEVCAYCGFSSAGYAPAPHHLPPYTILHGRYLLGAVLGEGGFGITYCAYDLMRGQRVALKELFIIGVVTRQGMDVTLIDQSFNGRAYYEECRLKFQQEAEALANLKDKAGVVGIEEAFAENNTGYIVMEYLDGVDLLTYLKSNGGRIPYADAFRLLRPIMKSMIEVHQRSMIHRDISPDNIRYLSNRQMKLMDFGSVKFTSKDSHSQLVMAKPGYTPLEQYSKDFKVGPWMDVYAMAATVYRCVTGKTPKASIDRTSDQDLPAIASYGVQAPPEVETVLRKGMALKAENRYQDMLSFYKELKEASKGVVPELNEELPKPTPVPPTPPTPPYPTPPQPMPGPVPTPPGPRPAPPGPTPEISGGQDPGYTRLMQELNTKQKQASPLWAILPGVAAWTALIVLRLTGVIPFP